MEEKKKIAILGGGFGGVYTAMYLQKWLKKIPHWEIVLITRENYFVYQPMLSEVIGGAVGILDTVSPIEQILPQIALVPREIEEIDLEKKEISISPKYTHTHQNIRYDHLVFALGNVTDFRGSIGLSEHALPFKNLADALRIRNHIIDVIDTAQVTKEVELKKKLLTFVVGGGGFSGTEVAAEINDFVRNLAKSKPNIDPQMIRVVLIHAKERLMDKELSESLSRYAEKILKKKGVEILFNTRLTAATPEEIVLDNGEKINCKTLISTVPVSSNPIIEALPLPKEKGRLKTDPYLQVIGTDHIWAVGDCARIPLPDEKFCPPTAQFATRQAKVLAKNIIASILGEKKNPFFFKSLGILGALGHRCAVAEILGVKLSGVLAWIIWRTLYWIKLPGISRKIKVAISWFLDTLFPIDAIQLQMTPSQGITKLHFETGDEIFREGDIGDFLYIITEGAVEVIKGGKGIARLKKGEFFGEIALLNQRTRTATIRCTEPTDVLALKKSDFGALVANFKELKETFEKTERERS